MPDDFRAILSGNQNSHFPNFRTIPVRDCIPLEVFDARLVLVLVIWLYNGLGFC